MAGHKMAGHKVLVWHVHGSWMTAFVQGSHEYFVPALPGRGPGGRGRAQTWDWPASVHDVSPAEAADLDVDVVILQRPEELHHLAEVWLGGRQPGRDLPAVYLEHNAPRGPAPASRHPAADRDDLQIVHVTHFNDLFWDTGSTRTCVVEHGVIDPGPRYTGELARGAATINEPERRTRVAGTDILERLAAAGPVDLFGMGAAAHRGRVQGFEHVDQSELHPTLAHRRVYLHPYRWTSLGLALIEAMTLGMPVVAVAATEVPEVIPPEAGVVSTNIDRLADGFRHFLAEPDAARLAGKHAREAALARFGLERFLRDWDRVLDGAAQ